MNKKILIGSIITVVILVLVSFSSVVGYSSVKPDSKISSPLFSVRNKKGDVSSDYLGKGKQTNLLIPERNSQTEYLDMVINIINRMDDKSFDRFIEIFIANINQNDKINYVEVSEEEISDMLYQLRDNSELIKSNFMIIKEEKPLIPTTVPTSDPLCILLLILLAFTLVIASIIEFIQGFICTLIPILPTFK